jgi:hypothetical protein
MARVSRSGENEDGFDSQDAAGNGHRCCACAARDGGTIAPSGRLRDVRRLPQGQGTSAMGPNLWGVSARKAGTAPGYVFSPAMKKAALPWTRANLLAFITDPRASVPGTKMAYAGQKDAKAAASITDYLMSLK